MAGATAATLLARQGIQVTIVDRWPHYPACFKAEKIEADQADLLRKFRLLDAIRPVTASIQEVLRVQQGRVIRRIQMEQYGVFYHDMVNAVRDVMPASVDFRVDRVQNIEPAAEYPTVTLASGTVLKPRLVVMACGTGTETRSKLGIQQKMIRAEQSWAAGFNIARKDGRPFEFDSITYYPQGSQGRLAFLTLFLIGQTMRANLFTYWSNTSQQARDLIRNPIESLEQALPGLTDFVGGYEVTSRVESARVDLYTTETPRIPGVVLFADAFQSVCPVTGTGLSKVLTDVDVLCNECVPRWLDSPGMSEEKLLSFYRDARKIQVDQHSLAGAAYARQIGVDDSFAWRLRRVQWHWENRVNDLLDTFRVPRKVAA